MNSWNPQNANAYVNYRKDALSTHQTNSTPKKTHHSKNAGKRKIKFFR